MAKISVLRNYCLVTILIISGALVPAGESPQSGMSLELLLLMTISLIAIMLGRLRMSVPQALSLYRDFGETIFGRKRRRAFWGINKFTAIYNHKNVETLIKSTIRDHCKEHQAALASCGRDTLQWTDMTRLQVDNNWNICQTYVVREMLATRANYFHRVCLTARENGKNCQPFLLRTYAYDHPDSLDHPDINGGVEELDFLIWEACRATSAAPLYFKHFEKSGRDGKKRRYIDGGVLMNNPSIQALQEVGSRHAIGQKIKKPALLLSVGTGIKIGTPFAGNDEDGSTQTLSSIRHKLALGKHVRMRYTESEIIHRNIRDGFAKGDKRWYKRLSVDEGLGQMDLGDWRAGNWTDEKGGERNRSGGATLTDIETAVKKYVTRDKLNKTNGTELKLLPKTMIDHTAQRLVRLKTKRENLAKSGSAEDRHRWEKHRGRWLTGEPGSSWEIETGDEPYRRK